MKHDWIKSTLGHGETMCSRCFITNREAAALGTTNICDVPPSAPMAMNDNAVVSQETVDAACIHDDDDDIGQDDDSDYDPGEECGRWQNGRLARGCSLAGTEWCDWDCPYSR